MNPDKKTLKPYDRTLRTAHTPAQIADAEELIKKIISTQDLYQATKGSKRFLQNKSPAPLQLLYAQYAEEDEFLAIQLLTAETNLEQLEESVRTARRLLTCLVARRAALRYHVSKTLDRAKEAIRQADLIGKKEDGFPPTEVIHFCSEALFISPPDKDEDTGSELPSTTSDLVRPLSTREQEIRQGHECYKCYKKGHWATDHYSYICQSCGQSAPGHASGTRWCGSNKNNDGTVETSYFEDTGYDDWYGEDGEHNLAT